MQQIKIDYSKELRPTIRACNQNMDQDPQENCEAAYAYFLNMLDKTGSSHKPKTPVENIWSAMSFAENKHSTAHVNMATPADTYNAHKGSFLISHKGERTLHKTHVANLANIDWIVMGGMDFYTLELFGALRKHFTSFHTARYGEAPKHEKVLYYYPAYTKIDRHAEILKFHDIDNYVSSEMQSFAEKYVIPKISKGEQLKFFCFSVSCRELLMIENACRIHFTNGLSELAVCTTKIEAELARIAHVASTIFKTHEINEIQKNIDAGNPMLKVQAFLFGHAFDWTKHEDLIFQKLSIISLADFGILRTTFNRNFLYGISLFNYGITMVFEDEVLCHNAALVFSAKNIPVDIEGKINLNGHNLGHYVECFNRWHNCLKSI